LSQANQKGSLAQDKYVRGIAILCALAAVPLIAPILGDQWRSVYGSRIVDLPFLVAAFLAIRYRLRAVTEARERRFWNLLGFGSAFWLGALLISMVDDDLPRATQSIAENAPYLLFYGAVAAALEFHPHVSSGPVTRLRALERIGSLIFLFGLLLYFLVLPGLLRRDAFGASSFALFVALDVYFILRLAGLRQSAVHAEWRSIYSWLLIGAAGWCLSDLGLLLMYEGILPDPGWGTLFDLIAPLAFCAVVVATRVSGSQTEARVVTTPVRVRLGMSPLVAYAVSPLLLHVSLYRFGMPDPDVRPARELLVLAFATMLAALTFAYDRLLRVENRRLVAEEASATEKLAHQAFHDGLTGLPNRNLFLDRLQQGIADAKRYKRQCAVLFCDIDQFKVINDSLGHEAGDQALVFFAERLKSAVRELDTVARFGGDEFAIILRGIHGALDAARLAEKILPALAEPLVVQGKSHVLTTSIGIAVFPDDGEDGTTLLKHSDTAMYQAKLEGGSGYKLFTKGMNDAAEERRSIEQGLRTARSDDDFIVYYQPIVDIATGQPVGYEALLRWNHPERGILEPASFLKVAEETGLIVPIGTWVLEKACACAAQMESSSPRPPSIAVNMSLRQLREPGLARDVITILERTGLDPQRLQLEITESMALEIDSNSPVLRQLRDLGVLLAVDDFGTGFSAMSRIKDLPIKMVKIDRSFVRGIEPNSIGETIVRAIVTMARALDLYVVAEGVETEAEFDVLRQLQCDAIQGFYFSGPVPAEELEAVMVRE